MANETQVIRVECASCKIKYDKEVDLPLPYLNRMYCPLCMIWQKVRETTKPKELLKDRESDASKALRAAVAEYFHFDKTWERFELSVIRASECDDPPELDEHWGANRDNRDTD